MLSSPPGWRDTMAAKKPLEQVQKIGHIRSSISGRLERENKVHGSVLSHSRALNDHLTIVLAKALNEWMARNPGRSVDEMNLTAVLPEAIDQFIWRHLDDSE
jgi:hypothetical protein